jgi:hypothetical protein
MALLSDVLDISENGLADCALFRSRAFNYCRKDVCAAIDIPAASSRVLLNTGSSGNHADFGTS